MNEAKIMDWIDTLPEGVFQGWTVDYEKDGSITIRIGQQEVEDAYNEKPLKYKIVDGPDNHREALHRDLDEWLYNATHLKEIENRMVSVPCEPK